MLKRHLLKLVVALAVVLTLLGGAALGTSLTAAKATSAHHLLACGANVVPPCT
jgi:hypothetical protein